ncbi:MAG: CYTH and CHAD domain-containing protein [Chloroflexi bacterium]|nr:MAG: CYTH and CHAD domain-containing protein [Chloroflexota bacterium]
MTVTREREVKLPAPEQLRLPNLDGVLPGVVTADRGRKRLQAVYYDTPDLRLARWGSQLRFRGAEGWTVKLPAPSEGVLLERDEHVFVAPAGPPPAEALDLVRGMLRGQTPRPVVILRTGRHTVELCATDGTLLAELVDDRVAVIEDGGASRRFRELEVELRAGSPALLDAVVARMRAAGAGAPDPTPKLVRALGRTASGPPDVAAGALPRHPSAGAAVARALAASVARLICHDPVVRLGSDPEGVHQARVATRRLRSDLRTFAPLLDAAWVEDLRAALSELAAELGEVRDADVMLQRLSARAAGLADDDRAGASRLLARLAERRDAARARLLATMRDRPYDALLDRLVEAVRAPALTPDADVPAADVLPGLVGKPWRKLRAAVRALPESPADGQLHRIRILTKRARYAAEAAAPVMGTRAARLARALARLQEVLGEHQDAVVAQAWLREAASAHPGAAFVAGELAGLEHADASAARAAWARAWRAASRPGLRAWLRPRHHVHGS